MIIFQGWDSLEQRQKSFLCVDGYHHKTLRILKHRSLESSISTDDEA